MHYGVFYKRFSLIVCVLNSEIFFEIHLYNPIRGYMLIFNHTWSDLNETTQNYKLKQDPYYEIRLQGMEVFFI